MEMCCHQTEMCCHQTEMCCHQTELCYHLAEILPPRKAVSGNKNEFSVFSKLLETPARMAESIVWNVRREIDLLISSYVFDCQATNFCADCGFANQICCGRNGRRDCYDW